MTTRIQQNGLVAVDDGWVILIGEGRRWDDRVYPTEIAAESVAKLCAPAGHEIRAARRVCRLGWSKRPKWTILPKADNKVNS